MPGYRLNIDENQIGKHLLCTLCCLLLRAPVQTVCGHRCCLSCVKEKRGSSDSFFCPDDGTEVTEVYPDRFVEREILNLQVTCINKCSGCTWNGAVKDYEVHFDTCQFVNSLCPNEGCVVTIARHALEKHMQNECKFRPINCPACDELIQFNFLKKHQQTVCSGTKVKCSQCGKDVLRGQLSSHQESECDEALVPCPFVKIGCAAKRPMKKNDKRKHMENAQSNHMTYLLNYSLELGSKAAAIEGALVQGKDTTYEEMEYDTETETAMKMGKLAVRELSVKKKGKNVPDSCPMAGPSQKHDLTSLPPDMASIRDAAFWDSSKSKEIDTQVSNLDSRITAMSLQIDDRYQELVDEIGKMNRNIDAVRDLCRKFESKFTANADWQQRTDVNMADQSDRIENVEFASYNGVIIWPIAEFMRKRHDSIVDSSWQSKFGYALLQERFVKFTLENHHILV